MATIQAAALKAVKDRRPSDDFKIKAGHMITFDQLAQQKNPRISERTVIRKNVRKNINRFYGCIALPLTLGYFFFYSVAARLHEDITHVFLMESEFRHRLDASLADVDTIPKLWNFFEGDFLDLFFPATDEFGDELTKIGTKGDKWGNWGRVLTYNQIQGVVIFEQSRGSDASTYGKESPCCTPLGSWCGLAEQILTYTQEGFVQNADALNFDPATFAGNYCDNNRRLGTNASVRNLKKPLVKEFERTSAEARFLKHLDPTLRSSLPSRTKAIGERFKFYLHPMDSQEQTAKRLRYFRERQYIDRDSKWLDVVVYLINADMGRPRLCEIKIQFSFALSGGIFYYLDLQTVMLKMFPNMLSIACDFIWFMLLVTTTLVYINKLWNAFVKGNFLSSMVSMKEAWELFVIFSGWSCVYGFYQQSLLITDVNTALEDLRALRWRNTEYNYLQKSEVLHDVTEDVFKQLVTIRYLMAQYLLFLMFRFLVSFAVQPRLATVSSTLKAVLPDMLHFLIVFIPTFLAYVISGSLIFGRRLQQFATVQASFSTCFRIIMECEYDWEELAAEYYWTTALWIWSFIVLIVLILLNMVLAIILDVYNEVRQLSMSGEPVWTTAYNFFLRARMMNIWVPDTVLEDYFNTNLVDKPMITREEIRHDFPDIPDKQLDLLYSACASDMGWEAKRFLDKTTCLKISGSVKMTTDSVNSKVAALTSDDDPLAAFTTVNTQSKKSIRSDGLFLASHCKLKGNRNPRMVDPKTVPKELAGVDEFSPQWMKDLSKMMSNQKRWMLYVTWQVENLQWQIQQSHLRKSKGFGGKQLL